MNEQLFILVSTRPKCHFQSMNINSFPLGRERKCKVGDFIKHGIGLPWRRKTVSRGGGGGGVERPTPHGESVLEACREHWEWGLQATSCVSWRTPAWLSLHALCYNGSPVAMTSQGFCAV